MGRPYRVAFVGQRHYFEPCSLSRPTPEIEPAFVAFRSGEDADALMASLSELAPHVVIVFRPEIIPAGLFASLPAVTVGYNTEPLPRGRRAPHPDLAFRLSELKLMDPGNFDRVVTFDGLSAETVGRIAPVWRAVPLPVDDEFYAPVRQAAFLPR